MKELNVIEMDKKVDFLPHSKRCSKSLVFLQLVDIAANQQPVYIFFYDNRGLPIITKLRTSPYVMTQSKSWRSDYKTEPVATH